MLLPPHKFFGGQEMLLPPRCAKSDVFLSAQKCCCRRVARNPKFSEFSIRAPWFANPSPSPLPPSLSWAEFSARPHASEVSIETAGLKAFSSELMAPSAGASARDPRPSAQHAAHKTQGSRMQGRAERARLSTQDSATSTQTQDTNSQDPGLSV